MHNERRSSTLIRYTGSIYCTVVQHAGHAAALEKRSPLAIATWGIRVGAEWLTWTARSALPLLLCLMALNIMTNPLRAEVRAPPFPHDLDLSSVERLYRSAAYRVEVKPVGAPDATFTTTFAFETRNDWTVYDHFNANVARRDHVLIPADTIGNPVQLRLPTGKADLRTASFAQAIADEPVEVRVTLLRPGETMRTVQIRPMRFQVAHEISPDRRSVRFRLDRPQKVSVEVNGRLDPLFVFFDAPDEPDLKATHYFAPGLHRIPGDGTLRLHSNERVYIAAGAIVEGRFLLEEGSRNITIRGRGLLSGGEWSQLRVDPAWQAQHAAIYSRGSSHLTLEGITLVQSTTWQVALDDFSPKGTATHDNQYRNIKTISWNGCTDGIWITGNNNHADDLFIFNNDDFFVTKGGRNSRISNAVVWGGTWGRFMLFQNISTNTPPVENILVENVDMIGKEGAEAMILFESWANPTRRPTRTTHNVTFRNITLEERRRPGNSNNTVSNKAEFIRLDTGLVPGTVSGLMFENIQLDRLMPSEGMLFGTSAAPIGPITFRSVSANGVRVTSPGQLHLQTNDHVHDASFPQ